MIIIHDLK